MAKNYTVAEAVKIIHDGEEMAQIRNIAARFPSFAILAAQLNDAGIKLFDAMPDWMTARKVDSFLKKGKDAETEDDSDVEEEEETPKKKAKKENTKKKSKDDEDEDDEDDDEEETPKKSKGKKATKKKSKDDEDEDDDDFDFE